MHDLGFPEEIVSELRPLITRFAKERNRGERFGDWSNRVLFADAPVAQN